MSMPPPQQPPNPYAQQPQYPQQPGYGQQPVYPGPGPQQGYPGGWGGPPMHPPTQRPPKNKGPMIALISVGSVALLLGLSWFGNNVKTQNSSSFPKAEYQLSAPATLVDGKYALGEDMSESDKADMSRMSEANIRNPEPTVARYQSEADGSVLVLSGMHGRIKDPDEARADILKGAGDADGSTIAVQPQDLTPAGSDVTVECQVLTSEQPGGEPSSFPMCAWADDNTNAAVAVTSAETATQSPEEIDLKSAAEATVKVREETRKPLA